MHYRFVEEDAGELLGKLDAKGLARILSGVVESESYLWGSLLTLITNFNL